MVEEDTTGLSDDALRDRLRVLRGEPVPEPAPTPVPAPMPAFAMPDLRPYGLQPLEITATKDGVYDSIRYEMRARVVTDEGRNRVLASIRGNTPMHMPDVFPIIESDGVIATRYDSDNEEVTLQAVISLEEIVDAATPPRTRKPSPKPAGWPMLIVGRRERAEDFARSQGLDKKDWRWVRTPRDLLGFMGRDAHMRVLDEGHPLTSRELEELLELAKDRGIHTEMVTFGPEHERDPLSWARKL